MKITVKSIKFKADQKLEDFINDKVSKLEKHASGILGAEVTLNVDKPESDNNKIADIKIEIAGKDLIASKQADTFEEAVMLAIDALKTQISKYKDKK